MNGWSNLAGVIAGQLFKSKYGPHCKEIEAQKRHLNSDCFRSFPTISYDDFDCYWCVRFHSNARTLDVGKPTTITDH